MGQAPPPGLSCPLVVSPALLLPSSLVFTSHNEVSCPAPALLQAPHDLFTCPPHQPLSEGNRSRQTPATRAGGSGLSQPHERPPIHVFLLQTSEATWDRASGPVQTGSVLRVLLSGTMNSEKGHRQSPGAWEHWPRRRGLRGEERGSLLGFDLCSALGECWDPGGDQL